MTRLRVTVDREQCAGYGNCVEVAPDIFELDEHDVAVVTADRWPTDRAEVLARAVRRCPPDAISVTEA